MPGEAAAPEVSPAPSPTPGATGSIGKLPEDAWAD
jgi:hypothetical protein